MAHMETDWSWHDPLSTLFSLNVDRDVKYIRIFIGMFINTHFLALSETMAP